MTLDQFLKQLYERFETRVLRTWLTEFGYTEPDVNDGLRTAAAERGPRLERELDAHGKRLAEREMAAARMGTTRITGRPGVIR